MSLVLFCKLNYVHYKRLCFQIADIGGSISIHSFGAYFGLGVSIALRMKKHKPPVDPPRDAPPALDGPSYISDVTATLGK